MPRDDIERTMPDLRLVELATPFDNHLRRSIAILKGSNGCFEITWVCKAIGPNRPTVRQIKLLAIILANKAATRSFKKLDAIDETARDDRDLLRFDVNHTQFRRKAQFALLRHHQQFRISGIEIAVGHRFGDQIDMACHANMRVHVPCGGHCAHAG